MKTPHLYLFFCIAFCMLALSSCEVKDNTPCIPRHTYHPLTTEEKSKTPYFTNPDFDTIRFASNTGDTLVFALQSIDSSWYIEDDNRNPEGCPNLQYYENRSAFFKEVSAGKSFSIILSKRNGNYPHGSLEIRYGEYFFWYGFWTIDNNGYPNYLQSLNINNQTYQGVIYEFESANSNINIKGYINSEYGLIQIADKVRDLSYTRIP